MVQSNSLPTLAKLLGIEFGKTGAFLLSLKVSPMKRDTMSRQADAIVRSAQGNMLLELEELLLEFDDQGSPVRLQKAPVKHPSGNSGVKG